MNFIVKYLTDHKKPFLKKANIIAIDEDEARFNFKKSGLRYSKIVGVEESSSNTIGNIFPDLLKLKKELKSKGK